MRRMGTVVVVVGVLLAGCSVDDARDGGPPTTDPLDQMVVAFDGSHSRSAIQAAMDRALTATGETISSETYSRAGSVLVSLRREYGVSEMDTLACIPTMAAAAPALDFPDAASLCVADLATQQR